MFLSAHPKPLRERGVCLPPGRGRPGNGGPVSHPRTGTQQADGPLPAVQQAGRSQPWPRAVSPSACSAHRRAGGLQPSPASSSRMVLTQAKPSRTNSPALWPGLHRTGPGGSHLTSRHLLPPGWSLRPKLRHWPARAGHCLCPLSRDPASQE